MSLPEERVRELREILGHYVKNNKRESLNAARDILTELRMSGALTAMGCKEACAVCPWGTSGAREWDNPCRLWTLWETLTDLEPKAVPGPAVRQQATDLLEALQSARKPEAKG